MVSHFEYMMGIIHFPVQIEGVNKITFDKTRNFLTLLLFSVTVYHCLKISKWWATFCFKRKCVVYDEWQKSRCSLKNTTMWYYYYLSQQFMLHDFWIFLFGWFVSIVVGGFCENAVRHTSKPPISPTNLKNINFDAIDWQHRQLPKNMCILFNFTSHICSAYLLRIIFAHISSYTKTVIDIPLKIT